MELGRVVIFAKRLPDMIAFYGEMLGLTVLQDRSHEGWVELVPERLLSWRRTGGNALSEARTHGRTVDHDVDLVEVRVSAHNGTFSGAVHDQRMLAEMEGPENGVSNSSRGEYER